MKRTACGPALALALAAASASAQIPSPARPASRAEATAIVANARRIVTPQGIERLATVRIGGIDQWVSIRGSDRRNPVLVVLHGGPGYVDMPMSWWFGRSWEDYFTVVYWDQRAAGKTWMINDPAKVAPTLSLERMEADAEELVDWARRDLGKTKVFVLGHSFGSYLGVEIARRHPDWLYAYIGVGQIADGPEAERRSWRATLAAARADGNATAVRELEALAPYPPPGAPAPIKAIYAERKWVGYYGGAMAGRKDNDAESDLADLSPDYTDEESRHIWDGNKLATPLLLPQVLNLDLKIARLDCPLILFEGRHDTNMDAEVAAEWFDKVQAPEKHLVWFENSAHLPMTEEPGKFLVSLVRYARPIAERAGDVAP